MRFISSLSLLFLLSSALIAAEKYAMADLEILAQEKNFKEYFTHALDPRPSERNDKWKELTLSMAEQWAKVLKQKAEITEEDFKQIEVLFAWPLLKNNEFYRPLRFNLGLTFLQNCFRKQTWEKCSSTMHQYWEADPTDPDTAVRMIELTQKFAPTSETYDYWPWLKVALSSPLSEFYCQKDQINEILWNKIKIEWIKVNKEGSFSEKIKSLMHKDCLPGLNAFAQKKLSASANAMDREQAFAILQNQKKLTTQNKDLFYIYFLMDNPAQGETFNYAWNELQALGKSAQKREKILHLIKKDPTLPDETMNSMDEGKRRVVLKEIHRHFPELLYHYGQSCLNYVSGKVTYERGNPTLHCKQIMQTDLAPEIFGPELAEQIKKHLKF